jgi:RNA polymerase sigma factor (sigma-70 family)
MFQTSTRRLLALPALDDSDSELIHRFANSRDEAAFAELVRRHGGLVRGVARRVLADPHAADDVFQAAFLLLATKASQETWGRTIGPWLYQAACRLAWKARVRWTRRLERSAPMIDSPAPMVDPIAPLAWAEVRSALDDELRRLPASQRDPLVLCYLEGLTRDEAAAALGCSPGELKGRLERGRNSLRSRLERRGLALSTGLAAVLVADPGVPVKAATAVAQLAARCVVGETMPAAIRELLRETWVGLGLKAAGMATVLVVAALGAAAMTAVGPHPVESNQPQPSGSPAVPIAQHPLVDADGDPLPPGAIARLGTVRFRTGGLVSALAFSPDGKQLASWSWAGSKKPDQLSLWDVASGRELRSIPARERKLMTLTWTPNGRGFAILQAQGVGNGRRFVMPDLLVWEFTSGKPEPIPPDAPTELPSVSFEVAAASRDGKQLAVTIKVDDKPGKPRIYELKATESVDGLKPLAEFDAPLIDCKSLAFTPDGKHLVGIGPNEMNNEANVDGTVIVWDKKTGAIVRTIAAPYGEPKRQQAKIAAANDRVAVGLESGDTFVADLRTGTGRTFATGHKATNGRGAGVRALDFSPDGRTLATTGMDGMVRVWDATGMKVREFGPHRNWSEAIAFTADGAKLASGGQDRLIRMWDPIAGKEIAPAGGLPMILVDLSLSADGITILSYSRDNFLRVWETRTGLLRRQIPTGGEVTACQLSADGTKVVAVIGDLYSPNKALKVWNAATGADVAPAGFPKTIVAGGFQFTPDRSVLITHFENQLVAWGWPGGNAVGGEVGAKLWAAEMPKPAKEPGANHIRWMTVSPDGKHFVTVAYRYTYREEKGMRFPFLQDGVVDLWNAKTGKRIRRVAEAYSPFLPAVYAPNGSLIVTNPYGFSLLSANGGPAVDLKSQIVVVDPLTGTVLKEFTPPERNDGGPNTGYGLALSCDGKVLFRGTDVGEVQAFEVVTGKFRTAWRGHRSTCFSLAAPTTDVRRLVSGSSDTTGLVWDVGFASVTPAPLTPERRLALWGDLTEADAEKAYASMRALAADPAGYVALASEKLTPTPPGPLAADLVPIFRDLGSATFTTREAAATKLDQYGESAVPQVRAHFEKEESAEVRTRLLAFLARHGGSPRSGASLRQVRAVELLEHLGTPEARRVLAALAAGGPSRQTADAAAVIERLQRRP